MRDRGVCLSEGLANTEYRLECCVAEKQGVEHSQNNASTTRYPPCSNVTPLFYTLPAVV